MRRRAGIMIVAVVAGLLAVSATAMAAKGDAKKPPPATTTTTTIAPTLWTCEARVANGAVWVLGTYDELDGSYTVNGLPACIDLLPADAGSRSWLVEWSGTVKPRPGMRGLKLVFEAEVHVPAGQEYAVLEVEPLEVEPNSPSGAWTPSPLVDAPADTPFVFVAMPYRGDKWTSIQITLTPAP
jgi:hypothetical protein